MIKVFFLLILISNIAFAQECNINQASQMVAKRTIGEVTDLQKDITPGQCVVHYRLNVDNEWHTVTWTHTGKGPEEFLCNDAIENGRKQLMTMLPGKYETENITVCKDGNTTKHRPVKIGSEILQNEVGYADSKKYFKYNGTVCRKFRERYNNGMLRVNNGIICKTDNGFWTVVDKW